jgi:hypothetical protein
MFNRSVFYKRSIKNYSSFSSKAKQGDTQLHEFIRDCASVKAINKYIQMTPVKRLTKMALTTNDIGHIPLDCLNTNRKLSRDDKIKIKNILLEIIKKNQQIKPMNELIRVHDILNSYYPNANDQLIANLTLACEIINEIRKKIKYSSTHPDYNYYNKKKKFKTMNRIHDGIRTDDNTKMFYKFGGEGYMMRQLESGNCGEMSNEAIRLLKNKSVAEYQAIRLHIKNGDHSFIAFGNINKGETDYQNAVFCDPWSGMAGKYQVKDLERHLGNYRRIYIHKNNPVNLITSYNSHYHQLALIKSYHITPD